MFSIVIFEAIYSVDYIAFCVYTVGMQIVRQQQFTLEDTELSLHDGARLTSWSANGVSCDVVRTLSKTKGGPKPL